MPAVVKKILHPEPAENGPDQITVVRITGSHGGGGRKDMTQCLFGLRENGSYTVVYPHQELLDKGWEKIVADAVFKNGVLDEYRIREAKLGENGPTLRSRDKERPYYVLSNKGIVAVEPSVKQQRYPVERPPTFDKDGACCIPVPSKWKIKAMA